MRRPLFRLRLPSGLRFGQRVEPVLRLAQLLLAALALGLSSWPVEASIQDPNEAELCVQLAAAHAQPEPSQASFVAAYRAMLGYYDEAGETAKADGYRNWLAVLVKQFDNIDPNKRTLGTMYRTEARGYSGLQRYDEAVEMARLGIDFALCAFPGDIAQIVEARELLARMYSNQGRHGEAFEERESALRLLKESGWDGRFLAERIAFAAAQSAQAIDRYDDAERLYRAAIPAPDTSLAKAKFEPTVRLALADLYILTARYSEAENQVREALAFISRAGSWPYLEINALNRLGIVQAYQLKADEAEATLVQILRMGETLQDFSKARLFVNLAATFASVEDFTQAGRYFRQAEEAYSAEIDGPDVGRAIDFGLARVYQAEGEHALALAYFEDAAAAEIDESPLLQTTLPMFMAISLASNGKRERALDLLHRVLVTRRGLLPLHHPGLIEAYWRSAIVLSQEAESLASARTHLRLAEAGMIDRLATFPGFSTEAMAELRANRRLFSTQVSANWRLADGS